ncbi:MAG: TonB-dependent receptor plug domain-containing protein, partial [Asticcacaulis sp.]
MIKTDMNRVARLMLATSVMGLSAGTALGKTKSTEPVEATTEVVVVGVRKSLAASRDLKRDDARVIDAIVAEDIAQFPQKNMAEALQRVSGVQLRRDFAGGVGNEISLRGLSPDYTAVTLNGQAAPSGADSRSFNFNTLPAELFRSVEVSKSPNARTDEGGIGGMVSLETLRPADLRGRKAVLTLEGTHNGITDKTSPRGTLVVGNTGERLSWVAGLAYSEFDAASQSYDAVRWRQRSYKLGTQSYDKVWLMDLPRYIHEQQSVERLALTLAGQFVVSPDFKLMADAVVVQNNQDYTRNSPIYFFDGATGLKDISVKDGIVEYASFGDVRFQAEDLYGTRETETRALRLRGDYQLGTLKFNPFVTVSDSQFEQTDLRYFADVRGPAAYDIRQDDDYFTITSPIDVTSTKGMLVRQARRFLSKTVDREAAAGLDLTWSVSETLKAEFGFKLRDRSKTRDRFEVTRSGINQPFEPVSKVLTGFLSDEGRAKGPNSFVVFDPDLA